MEDGKMGHMIRQSAVFSPRSPLLPPPGAGEGWGEGAPLIFSIFSRDAKITSRPNAGFDKVRRKKKGDYALKKFYHC